MNARDLFATLAATAVVALPLREATADPASCEAQMGALEDRVIAALDRAETPWVTFTNVVEPFCTGERTTRTGRRLLADPHQYYQVMYDNGTYVVRHTTFVIRPPHQPYADPGTIVGIGEFRDLVVCPDGSTILGRGLGNDVPADLGASSGSNPLIVDFGGDDYLWNLQMECALP